MNKPANTLSAGRPSARTNKETTLASLSDDSDMKRINFQVSSQRHRKLKITATKVDKSIKEFMTEYIDSLPDVE